MWNYSEKVLDLFYHPLNQGEIKDEQESGMAVVRGEVGSIACGDALRLHLKIDVTGDRIIDAKFQTFGCTSAIASSSALTEMVKGLELDRALGITNRDIANYLGGLPEQKMHCSVMGQEALEKAIYSYRGLTPAHEEEEEGALLCTCFAVTANRVKRVVQENRLTSAEEVMRYVKAGGGCGTCLSAIDEVIESVLQPQPLTTVQKIGKIETSLDGIRPYLQADGGDVELFDVEGDRVSVRLKGACGSCASSLATLKDVIEERLRREVLPSLVVEAV
ncbi:MAG: Fe-S cluster assembly protein NifU [Oscillatoriales cyanobacterium SM2_2_1]|nr:Fe-S cluster assembly protein NifU [Oscillatoriales cyanobacterium SM2_2_1]